MQLASCCSSIMLVRHGPHRPSVTVSVRESLPLVARLARPAQRLSFASDQSRTDLAWVIVVAIARNSARLRTDGSWL
jgi:hypothetical protein